MAEGAGASNRQVPRGATSSARDKLRVFISYSRDDLAFADQLVAGLELCNFDPTLDRHAISGGEAWEQRLGALIREADTVVFVLSPASAASKVCAWEVGEAMRLNKRIVPVLALPLDGTAPPGALRELNYIFFYADPAMPGSGFGSGLARLVAALNTDLDWLREHTRLLQRATEWDGAVRPVNRLLSGSDIVAAKDWAARRPHNAPEPTGLHLDFIRASEEEEVSRASAERRRLDDIAAAQAARETALAEKETAQKREAQQALRVVRRTQHGISAALLLAALAGWNWWEATQERDNVSAARAVSEEATRKAKLEAKRADAELGRSLSTTVRFLGRQRLSEGDYVAAAMISIEALDAAASSKLDQALLPVAAATLTSAVSRMRERQVLGARRDETEQYLQGGHTTLVNNAVFSLDGKLVVTTSRDGSARVWETSSGRLVTTFEGHLVLNEKGEVDRNKQGTYLPSFEPNGQSVLTLGADETVRVWRADTGYERLKLECKRCGELTNDLAPAFFGPEGMTVAVWQGDVYSVHELQSGKQLRTLPYGLVNFDRTRLVTIAEGSHATLVDVATGTTLTVLHGPEHRKARTQFSRNGRFLALQIEQAEEYATRIEKGIYDLRPRRIDLWNAVSGTKVAELLTDNYFDNMLISDNGEVVVNLVDRIAEVWHVPTESRIAVIKLPEGDPSGTVGLYTSLHNAKFALSPDGSRLVSLGHYSTSSDTSEEISAVWDTRTGARIATLLGDSTQRPIIRFNKTGSAFLTAHEDGIIRFWDTKSGASLGIFVGHKHRILNVEFSPDDQLIATASEDRTARIWSVKDARGPRTLPGTPISDGERVDVEFSTDGTRLLTSRYGGQRSVLHDTLSGQLIAKFDHGSRYGGRPHISGGGSRVLTPFGGGSARIWDIHSGALISQLESDPNVPFDAVGYLLDAWLSPDGARVVTLRKGQGAAVWNATTGKHLFSLGGPIDLAYPRIRFAPTGNEVAFNHHPAIWNLDNGKVVRTVPSETSGPEQKFWGIWSEDLAQINTGQSIIDARTGKTVIKIVVPDGLRCETITAWSRTGRRVATRIHNGYYSCLFDGTTGQFIKSMELKHAREVLAAYFLADDTRVLTVAPDDAPQLWDAETGQHVASLGVTTREQQSHFLVDETPVSFSADRKRIATAHYDGFVRVWDAVTGHLLAEFNTNGPMRGVDLSSDGSLVAAPAVKGRTTGAVAYVWPLFRSTADLVNDAKRALPRCLSNDERRENFLDAAMPDWCFEFNKWPTWPIRVGVNWRLPADPKCTNCGAVVGRVIRGLPADLAGIEAGDVIIALDSVAITSNIQFNELIAKIQSRTSVKIKVRRSDAEVELLLHPRL